MPYNQGQVINTRQVGGLFALRKVNETVDMFWAVMRGFKYSLKATAIVHGPLCLLAIGLGAMK